MVHFSSRISYGKKKKNEHCTANRRSVPNLFVQLKIICIIGTALLGFFERVYTYTYIIKCTVFLIEILNAHFIRTLSARSETRIKYYIGGFCAPSEYLRSVQVQYLIVLKRNFLVINCYERDSYSLHVWARIGIVTFQTCV